MQIVLGRSAAGASHEAGHSVHELRLAAIELAAGVRFRRLLHAHDLPFEVFIPAPLRRVPHFMVFLGSRPCLLLESPGFKTAAPPAGRPLPPETIVVLYERKGNFPNSRADLAAADRRGEPLDLVNFVDRALPRRAGPWDLAGASPADLEAVGQQKNGGALTASIVLRPGERARLPVEMVYLTCLRTQELPPGELQLYDQSGRARLRFRRTGWHSVLGRDAAIRFVGWTSLEAYQADQGPLFPLDSLMENLQVWHAGRHAVKASQGSNFHSEGDKYQPN